MLVFSKHSNYQYECMDSINPELFQDLANHFVHYYNLKIFEPKGSDTKLIPGN